MASIRDNRGDTLGAFSDPGKWKMTGFLGRSGYYTPSAASSIMFDALMGFTKRKSREAIEKVLQRLVRNAKKLAPVRSGALKSSIVYFMVPNQPWGGFGSDLPYARYVNDGTSKMTGRHFMEGAIEMAGMEDLGLSDERLGGRMWEDEQMGMNYDDM